jgi:hypothetical protein
MHVGFWWREPKDINRWEGLRVGFSIILKFVVKKDTQTVTELNINNISCGREVKAAGAYG